MKGKRMYKKGFKRKSFVAGFLASFVAIAMVATMVLPTFNGSTSVKAEETTATDDSQTKATNDISDTSSTDADKGQSSDDTNTDNTKTTDKKDTSVSSGLKSKQLRGGMLRASGEDETTETGFAIFDAGGTTPTDLAGTGTSYGVVSGDVLNQKPHVLTINASFTNDGTGKHIKIYLNDGMALKSAPGMTGSGRAFTFDSSQLSSSLNGGIIGGTFTANSSTADYTNLLPKGGVLDYTVADGVNSISFDINLLFDYAFYYVKDQTLNNSLQVQTIEGSTVTKTATLESLVTTQGFSKTVDYPARSATYLKPGQSWTNDLEIVENQKINQIYWKEANLKIRMPKAFGLSSDIVFYNGGWPTKQSSIETSLDTTSDSTYDYLTVKLTPSMDDPYANKTFRFSVSGTVKSDAENGTTGVAEVVGDDSYAICGDGTKDSIISDGYNNTTMHISTEESKLTVGTLSTTPAANTSAISQSEWSSPSDYTFLGAFAVSNKSPDVLNGYRVTMKFSDSHIGVKAFQYGTSIKNVVIETSKNNTIPIDINSAGIIAPNGLDDDEYITSVTATMVDIPVGYSSDGEKFRYSGFPDKVGVAYYGKLLGDPGDYSADIIIKKATTTDPNAAKPDVTSEWEDFASVSQGVTCYMNTADNIGISYGVTGNIGGSLISGGSSKQIGFKFTLGQYKYEGLTQLQAFKGVDVYVRQPLGFTIDPSTVYAVDPTTGTKIYADKDPIVSSVDNSKIYVIHMPDTVLTFFKKAGTYLNGTGYVIVRANISANVTTPSSNIPLRQIFMADVGNMAEKNVGGWGGDAYVGTDDYNIISTSAKFAAASKNIYVSSTANVDINVSTAASHGSSDYENYNPNATNPADTIIDLSTKEDANYKVSLSNNTTGDAEASTTVIIPIPKKGEKPGPRFIDSSVTQIDEDATPSTYAFKWSANLKSSVESMLSAQGKNLDDYTIKYSTNYTTDKDSADFVSYALLSGSTDADKLASVKAVEVVYNNSLPEGYTDDFFISLTMPQNDDATAAQGKVNYYSSSVYRESPSVSGYATSLPVALRANTGIIGGNVYSDTTKNYKIDTATGADKDTGLPNVGVKAYEKGADISTATPVDTGSTAADGSWELINLKADTEYDIVFSNPKTANAPMGFVTLYDRTQDKINDGATWKVSDITANAAGSDSINALLQTPYKVAFDTTGNTTGAADTGATINSQYVYNGKKATSVTSPSKTGETFHGWFYKASDTGTYADTWTKWAFDTDTVDTTAVTSDKDNDANTLTLRAGYSINNSTLSVTEATYDKQIGNDNHKSITTVLTLKGNTVSKIMDGTTELDEDAYTAVPSNDGTTITYVFDKDYLNDLDTTSAGSPRTFTFDMNQGIDPSISITINDSIQNTDVSASSTVFDKKLGTANNTAIVLTLDLKGNVFKNLKVGSKTLTSGTDYTYDSNNKQITINKSYLMDLPFGTANFEVIMNQGDNPEVTLTVMNSTDTDGDGVPDFVEEDDGTDIDDPTDFKDRDKDGVPDYVEDEQGTKSDDKTDFQDTDEDGVPDYVEKQEGTDPEDKTSVQDTDKDGVPDYVEKQEGTDPEDKTDVKDTDGDGVPDYVEKQEGTDPDDITDVKDTDGDGVPDYVEKQEGTDPDDKTDVKDTDKDGVPDYVEKQEGTNPDDKTDVKDTDKDGVPDYVEKQEGTDPDDKTDVKDTDGDGVPDYVEEQEGTDPDDITDVKDTDKDGVPDYVEEQEGTDPEDKTDFQDTDGDGVPDYVEDQEGTNPDEATDVKDTDEDGVPDYVEEQNGTDPDDKTDYKDTDGDGVPDYQEDKDGTDPDDATDFNDGDGDGVPDYVEEQEGTDPDDKNDFTDDDNDGKPDYDKDSDGDGVPDSVEKQDGTDPDDKNDFKDTDGDGVPDYVENQDGTNADDATDAKDTDKDGVPDYVENQDGTDPDDKTDFKDDDKDGKPDYDKDSDGDGVPDSIEENQGTDPDDATDYKDTDKDGVPDYVEEEDGTDKDDATDSKDSDGDGVPDYVENEDGTNPDDATDFKDRDGDGVPDYVEKEDGTDPDDKNDFTDDDNDGKPDYDKDSDGDGVPDSVEDQEGTDPDDKNDYKDTDGDGVPDYVENEDGTDPDDATDAKDTDKDGVPDYVENQDGTDPDDNTDFTDDDNDGKPDYDKDSDGDGVPDSVEENQGTNPGDATDYKDTDKDGVPDYVEDEDGTNPDDATDYKDTDGDGVPDYQESKDGTDPDDATDFKDGDGDGVPDYVEDQEGTDPDNGNDFEDDNNDGKPDYQDDTDGDEVPDSVEKQEGTDPKDATKYKDTDKDEVPDYVENKEGTKINDDSSYKDTDGDEVPDYVERREGTDPKNRKSFRDTDGDGVPDYVERHQNTNPDDSDSNKDTDGDGVPDYVENQDGTDPDNASSFTDKDKNGVPDYVQNKSINGGNSTGNGGTNTTKTKHKNDNSKVTSSTKVTKNGTKTSDNANSLLDEILAGGSVTLLALLLALKKRKKQQ
ncbi:MAG: hypothetical protein LBM02_01505 [Lachnospiraceae bacterium]|nr:hypothetical protein [Lachnospiraceae bacterium]